MHLRKKRLLIVGAAGIIVAVSLVLIVGSRQPSLENGSLRASSDFRALAEALQIGTRDGRDSFRSALSRYDDAISAYPNLTADEIGILEFALIQDEWKNPALDVARRYMLGQPDAIDEIIFALNDSDCYVFPMPENTPLTQLLFIDDFSEFRRANRILIIAMRQSIVEQDWEQASAIANALRRLIESGGGSPTLIAHVVNISIINFISEEFRMLARENDLPVDVLRSMRESLERALAANTRLQGSMILGEKYFTMEVYESIRSEMTLKERMQSMFKNDGYSVGAAAKAYTIAGTYWNASRSSREAMEATGSWSRNEFIQYTIGLFVRIRTHTDVMAHELYVSLAVLDLEILHDESGEYPEELPKEMIERIPAGIRFGDGMIYVVSDDRQSYELLMTPEFPEKWREQSNGRFRLKREPLSQEDLGLLESAAKTLKAEGFEEPPVQD